MGKNVFWRGNLGWVSNGIAKIVRRSVPSAATIFRNYDRRHSPRRRAGPSAVLVVIPTGGRIYFGWDGPLTDATRWGAATLAWGLSIKVDAN